MEFNLIISFLPFAFLLMIGLLNMASKRISTMPYGLVLLFITIMTMCIGFCPIEGSSDRGRYASMYMAISNNRYWGEYKDVGWQLFMTFCTKVIGNNYQIFFLIIASVYSFSYYKLAKYFF